MLLLLLLSVLLFFDLLLQFGHIVVGQISDFLCGLLLAHLLASQIFDSDLFSRFSKFDFRDSLPIFQNFQNLVDCRPILGIGYQYNMNQILQLLAYSIVNCIIAHRHEILRVQNAYLASVLVRVVIEGQGKKHAANHPNVDLRINLELHVLVNHFRRSIHHSCELFIVLKLILDLLVARPRIVVQY